MRSNMFFMVLVLPFFLLAKNTGSIEGIVIDKETGEPISCVNVVIKGTVIGAATNEDGFYCIKNVPEGQHEISASYIGYITEIKSIYIKSEKKDTLNFEIKTDPDIDLSEPINLGYYRPAINFYSSFQGFFLYEEDIENLPVREFNDIMQYQQGAIVQDDQLHVRGGLPGETSYYLDGMNFTNLWDNSQMIRIIPEAISELDFNPGGFSTQYQGGTSGLLQYAMKTGSDQYRATVNFHTDKLAESGDKFLGTYSYRHHYMTATVSGPIINRKIRFFGAFENSSLGDSKRRFSKGFTFNNLENPSIEGELVNITYPDGYTPKQRFYRNTFNGNLQANISDQIRLSIIGGYEKKEDEHNNIPMLTTLNQRDMWDITKSAFIGTKLEHILSQYAYYKFNFNYFNQEVYREDDYFGRNWQKWTDSAAVYNHTNGEVVYSDAATPMDDYRLGHFPIQKNGQLNTPMHMKGKTTGYQLSGNYLHQIQRHHQLNAGFNFSAYTIRKYKINSYINGYLVSYPEYESLYDLPTEFWLNSLDEAFGYSPHGMEIDDRYSEGLSDYLAGPRQPKYFSLFIEDNIDYANWHYQIGLRLEQLNSSVDYYNPSDFGIPHDHEKQFKTEKPFYFLSPRIGIIYKLNYDTKLWGNWGRYVQAPALGNPQFLNYDINRWDADYEGDIYLYTPRLFPMQSGIAEIGVQHNYQYKFVSSVGLYFKQSSFEYNSTSGILFPENANIISKGLEASIKWFAPHGLTINTHYTMSRTSNYNTYEKIYYSLYMEKHHSKNSYYDHTHKAIISAEYQTRRMGFKSFNNFLFITNFKYHSGHPIINDLLQYSNYRYWLRGIPNWNESYNLGSKNKRTPDIYEIDLSISKSFRINKLGLNFYLKVTNLLNRKNVINAYTTTGKADNDGFLSDPQGMEIAQSYGEDYIRLYEAINQQNGQAYWYAYNKQLYGHPRQIIFGISLLY